MRKNLVSNSCLTFILYAPKYSVYSTTTHLIYNMISLEAIPESLRLDKDVTPYINRSIELNDANPVVSYYCKLYVLEHILTLKQHLDNKEVEIFTISLLDETEQTKNSQDDEALRTVLNSRQLSLNAVFVFAFKIFNSCLEDLSNYDGVSKAKIGSKIKAALNFWSLLLLFSNEKEETVDYANTTGGQCKTAEEFAGFCKEKQKALKFQLSRLIKNEIPVKADDDDELERELEFLTFKSEQDKGIDDVGEINEEAFTEDSDIPETAPAGPTKNEKKDDLSALPPSSNNGFNGLDFDDTEDFSLPGAPKFLPGDDSADFKLPGAPKFLPDDNDGEFKLPGAPKFLPDDDLSHINKKSSIVVFSPDEQPKSSAPPPPAPKPKPEPPAPARVESNKLPAVHVTKENLSSILDFSEQITKIQKHAKFAISALNYEDLETAEKELLQGLELLRVAKSRQ
ncbi:hypothetical protein PUMCH_001114 [Australozyma saopauloensis]|uniref:Vacuolar protein sorting-associated protein VTA1 n=1 Tax=Australozyma saopauloensis TaxID=291208 RepID=A0AAX4H677_9ASCO|nr:hypothetical protein PUMCH_001114 [[Candida] saopauloensis]